MKPEYRAQAAASHLSEPQSIALNLLHLTQGTRHYGSGVSINSFLSMERAGLAKEDDGSWYLTAFGGEVQAVIRAGS